MFKIKKHQIRSYKNNNKISQIRSIKFCIYLYRVSNLIKKKKKIDLI